MPCLCLAQRSFALTAASQSTASNSQVAKLLRYAEATDVCFVRVGTSGGVGVAGGTIVVTNRPLNGFLKPSHEIISLGKSFERPSSTDARVRALLTKSCKDAGVQMVVIARRCGELAHIPVPPR
jgi:uridine phosphorylase